MIGRSAAPPVGEKAGRPDLHRSLRPLRKEQCSLTRCCNLGRQPDKPRGQPEQRLDEFSVPGRE
jgi:hypothetical protein